MKKFLCTALLMLVASLSFGQMTTFDGVDDYLEASPSAYTNDATGTWVIWRSRTSLPVDKSSQGEQMLSYCYNGSANIAELIICDYDSRPSGRTNLVQVRAIVAGATKWALEFDSNTAVSDGTPQMIAVVHDGTTPIGYLDGVAANTTFANSNDKTVWVNKFTGVDTVCYGASLYNGSAFYHYAGTLYIAEYFPIALTAAQVSALYRTGADPVDTDTVVDWSLNGNDGVMNGATYRLTDRWEAVFDTDYENITLDDESAFRFNGATEDFYIMMWVTAEDNGAFDAWLWDKRDSGVDGYGLYLANDQKVKLVINAKNTVISTASIPINTRTLVVASVDRDGDADLYFGDTFQTNYAVLSEVMNTTATPTIGKRSFGVDASPYKGAIDTIIVGTQALTQADVTAYFSSNIVPDNVILRQNMTPAHKRPVLELDKPAGLYAGGDAVVEVQDEAGGNDGTITGDPAWFTGTTDGYLDFDGSDDFVDLGSDSSLQPANKLSISAWVSLEQSASQDFLTQTTTGNFICRIHSDDKIRFFINGGVGYANSSGALTQNEKTHILLTYDTSLGSDNMKIYINGVLDGTDTYNTPITANANPVQIAQNFGGGESHFGGKFYDLRIYNSAISSNQALAMAGGTLPTNTPVSVYSFDRQSDLYKNKGSAGSSADATAVGNPTVVSSVPSVVWDDVTVNDISGSGNNGGNVGQEILLDGDNFVAVGDASTYCTSAIVANPTSGTLCFRVMHTNLVASGMTGGAIGGYSTAGGTKRCFLVVNNKSVGGALGNVDQTSLLGATDLTLGQWHHLAMTWDASTLKVYLDGIQEDTAGRSGDPSLTALWLTTYNENATSAGIPLANGSKMDDCRIYSSALTSNQLYNLAVDRVDPTNTPSGIYNFTPLVKPSPKINTGRNK